MLKLKSCLSRFNVIGKVVAISLKMLSKVRTRIVYKILRAPDIIKKKSELSKYGCYPNVINIDACNICQLKCPLCWQSKEEIPFLGKGYLKFIHFKKFVDTHPTFKVIQLSGYGEIFLNPDLKDIIKYAYMKKVELTALSGVNLNTVSEDVMEHLVKYNFKEISISLDGATNATYKIYRINGDFNTVINNIKRINYYKLKFKTNNPILNWQFVIFGHNEHELPIAKKMASELNMRFYARLNRSSSCYPVTNKEHVKKYLLAVTMEEYEQRFNKMYIHPCRTLWLMPLITWDGKLLGCCVNKWVNFGNVFERGLEGCIKSRKYILTKKVVLGKMKPTKDTPCYYCGVYKKIRAHRYFVDPYNTEAVRANIFTNNI